jgi:hypothetical protein
MVKVGLIPKSEDKDNNNKLNYPNIFLKIFNFAR